ncbi:MAG: ABC transporter [Betaproteobacteria bacterium HGW-Betaproteobacteria-11]|nr:MAG: ABC transporter [Betaproteobacteria bacterium HGW-Betaproteobacteria-11]
MSGDLSLLAVDRLCAGWSRSGGPVVGPVSFAVQGGEILGLAGPNGAGKSTLLAAISGAAQVFSGGVTLAPGARLALQMQQTPELSGIPLSGSELLRLTGAPATGLPPYLQRRLFERLDRLSGGQRQCLHLWACLDAPGEVVLLDEPTNNLDPAGVEFLATALRQRAAQGAAIVLVSHDGEFLAAVCHRIERLG